MKNKLFATLGLMLALAAGAIPARAYLSGPASSSSSTAVNYMDLASYFFFKEEFSVFTTAGSLGSESNLTFSGTIATVQSESTAHIGIVSLSTGASGTGASNYLGTSDGTYNIYLGGGVTQMDWIVKLPNLSTAGEAYNVIMGLGTNSNTAPADGLVFYYAHGSSSGNWELRASSGGAGNLTTRDTGIAATTNWVHLKWILNAACTSAQAYIDGTAAGAPITTNLPCTNGMRYFAGILKSNGTTPRKLYLDAFSLLATIAK